MNFGWSLQQWLTDQFVAIALKVVKHDCYLVAQCSVLQALPKAETNVPEGRIFGKHQLWHFLSI